MDEGRVALTWDSSGDLRPGDRYQIYVDDPTIEGEHLGGDEASDLVTSETTFTVTSTPFGEPLVGGRTYTFRISAGGAGGTYGSWTAGVTATMPPSSTPPEPPVPQDPTGSGGPAGGPGLDRPVTGRAIYASPAGSDSNPGTISSPLRSIERAVAQAQPGDTVLVRGGTYARHRVYIRRSGAAGKPITVRPYPGETVVIDGQTDTEGGSNRWFSDAGLVTIAASHIVFEGFEVKNSSTHGIHASGDHLVVRRNLVHHTWMSGIETWASDIVIEDNEVYSATMNNYRSRATGWAGGIITTARAVGVLARNVTIRRNFVHELWGEGIHAVRSDGFAVQDNVVRNAHSVSFIIESVRGTVERNFAYADGNWSTSRYPARAFIWGGEDIWVYPAGVHNFHDVTLRNNVFYNQGDAAFLRMANPIVYNNFKVIGNTFYRAGIAADSMIGGTGSGNVLKNNILKGRVRIADRSTWSISHNSYPDGDLGGQGLGANAFVGDPHFVAPGGHKPSDYKLRDSSPLRNRGVPLADLVRDFFHNDRGDAPTIGSHE